MPFVETPLVDAYVLEIKPFGDERGFFAEAWKPAEAEPYGITKPFIRNNLSFNVQTGTLRGLHAQKYPHDEAKLVRCIRGAIYDVIVDVRPESATYCRWFGVELSAENRRSLYVPEGFLHGFQTLVDETEVLYQCSNVYAPDAEYGARYNDPAFGIDWPLPAEKILSRKDANWPAFRR